ncbi:hypothetical protein ACFFRR_001836 [Megaselia abdita]
MSVIRPHCAPLHLMKRVFFKSRKVKCSDQDPPFLLSEFTGFSKKATANKQEENWIKANTFVFIYIDFLIAAVNQARQQLQLTQIYESVMVSLLLTTCLNTLLYNSTPRKTDQLHTTLCTMTDSTSKLCLPVNGMHEWPPSIHSYYTRLGMYLCGWFKWQIT